MSKLTTREPMIRFLIPTLLLTVLVAVCPTPGGHSDRYGHRIGE